jgi:hypothetical protein
MTRVLPLVLVLGLLTAGTAFAGDFDGSKLLICAPVEAIDCAAGEACTTGRPEALGLPRFLRIDVAQKVIVGPQRTTPILFMDHSDNQLLLHGKELGYGWTLVLDQESGTLSATLVNREGAVVLFGSCTPL